MKTYPDYLDMLNDSALNLYFAGLLTIKEMEEIKENLNKLKERCNDKMKLLNR